MKIRFHVLARCRDGLSPPEGVRAVARFEADVEWQPLDKDDKPLPGVPYEILEICMADNEKIFRQAWLVEGVRRVETETARLDS